MVELPERIKRLAVTVGAAHSGELLSESGYVFTYAADDPEQPTVSLLMPASISSYRDGEVFPSMDMNLPEGFLLGRVLELHPKRQMTKMHLLSMVGTNGIGRVGFSLPGSAASTQVPISKERILSSAADADFFQELVAAYLSTGIGISGVQPKIMVPTRSTMPIPDLIVKAAGPDYPGIAANEFLCLSAARQAQISVPEFDLSNDGSILVLDRFDVSDSGWRSGFEDIAALMGLRVHGKLSNRKYHGSYEDVASVIQLFSSNRAADLASFYGQLVLSVLVRNGDAHLKNFGMLYTSASDVRLSPLFDVVTTTMYPYERPGGIESVDRTMALKWRKGKHFASRSYPTTQELLDFGAEVCSLSNPHAVVQRVGAAMSDTLAAARSDERIASKVRERVAQEWASGMSQVQEAAQIAGSGRRVARHLAR